MGNILKTGAGGGINNASPKVTQKESLAPYGDSRGVRKRVSRCRFTVLAKRQSRARTNPVQHLVFINDIPSGWGGGLHKT